jgi:2',3'-cyclic-nucleotide 2'-phosphodiesterase (5'-nucleotidase family)
MIPISFKGNTEFNVLYFSDIHAKIDNIRHFKTAVDEFDRKNKDKNTLKLAGGDINFASDIKQNVLLIKLMNLIGLDASCVGNHDIEGGDYWAKVIELSKPVFKFLSVNLSFSRPNKVEDKIAKSIVIERKSEQVGIIGITAFDAKELIYKSDYNDYFSVLDFNKTVTAVKQEIVELEKQGINKIFLLAHTGEKSAQGFEYYKNLARIGGIDVIIGGHDHKEFDKWYTSERGEPVKVVAVEAKNDKNKASEDLGVFGILKLLFNDEGVLIPSKCNNKFKNTKNYPVSVKVELLEEKILQNNRVICRCNHDLKCSKRKTQENPVADLLADSMFWIAKKINPKSRAQIALINSGEINGDLPKGDISKKDIKKAIPYTHQVVLVEASFTKKQLFDALNHGIKTTSFSKQTLGLLQVGGLKYTVGKDNMVKDVYLVNNEGISGERLDDMPEDKEYTILYDTYLMNGTGGMSSLKKDKDDPNIIIYPYNHQSGLIEYLKQNFSSKPVQVNTGRIKIEN